MSPLLKYWMHENKVVDDDGNVIETIKEKMAVDDKPEA